MALNGIDISHAQTGINLLNVPADFVIMKATDGTQYVIGDCDRQYQQAKKKGALRGVYHYAKGGDPVKEADFFLKNIEGYIGDAMLCLDWESLYNPAFGVNDKEWVKAFCDHVYKRTRVKCVVYVQASAMNRLKGIGDYGLWVAQYPDYVRTGYQEHPWNEGAYDCVIRQYSSSGKLPGYANNLDLDKFYGDKQAWLKYVRGDRDVEPKPDPKPIKPTPKPTPVPQKPAYAPIRSYAVEKGQREANRLLGTKILEDGLAGVQVDTIKVRVLQHALNKDYLVGITENGKLTDETLKALGEHTVRAGEVQAMVQALQILLLLNGYNPLGVDSIYGNGTGYAVKVFQLENGLTVDEIAGRKTFLKLVK